MKNYKHWALIVSLLLATSSCQQSNTATQPIESTTVLLFIDKSPSTNVDENQAIKAKNERWLKRIVHENIQSPGDQIVLSYIYEATNAAGNAFAMAYQPPVAPNIASAPEIKQKQEEIHHLNQSQQYKSMFVKEVLQKAQQVGHEGQSTFVLGGLPVISDWTSKIPSDHQIKLYFLSDMKEWSDLRQMTFTGENGLTSIAKAQELAKEDLVKVKAQLQVPDNALSRVGEITIISPTTTLQEEAYQYIPAYWNAIFQGLGGPKANYH